MLRIITILSLSVFLGCSNSMGVSDYIEWNKENKIESSLETEDLIVSVAYRPNELMALNELREEIYTLDMGVIQEIFNQYENGTYFLMTFGTKEETPFLRYNLQNDNEYNERVQYLSTQVAQDIVIVQSTDTLRVKDHIFERSYALRPQENILLYFNKDIDKTKSFDILYTGLFASRPVKFTFNPNQFINLPKVKI